MVKRGEIWWALLPEATASEPGYKRPVIIVQADDFNRSRINTVVAVPLTSNLRLAEAPGNVRLPIGKTSLRRVSVANVSQIITFDKQFLGEKIGHLDRQTLQRVDEGIRLVLAV